MSKLTPYAALCEIFKNKFCPDNTPETTEEPASPKNLLKIDNSCQTNPLRDYSLNTVIKTPTRIRNLSNVGVKDDNFQILQPDYAAYSAVYPNNSTSGHNKIKLVAEKPQEETDRFNFGSFTPMINKLRGRSTSPPKATQVELRNETTMTEPTFHERIISPTHKKICKPVHDDLVFPELNLYRNNNSVYQTREYNNNIPYNPYRTHIHSELKNPKINAVYRTVSDLRTAFEEKYDHCENDEKCLCGHCGAWNLVNDSLKRPQIFPDAHEEGKRQHKTKRNKFNDRDYLKLSMKLKMMEERVHELEENNYTQGPFKYDNSLTFDMYTQCQKKKKAARFKEENSKSWSPKRSYPKNCPFPFGFPPNFFKKRFSSEEREARNTESEEFRVEHESRSTKRSLFPKPRLRCQEYINKKNEETPIKKPGFWRSTNKETFNIQVREYPKKEGTGSPTIEINLDTITEKQVQDLLIQLNKRKITSQILKPNPTSSKSNINDTKIIYERDIKEDFSSRSCVPSQNEELTKYSYKKNCSTIQETSKETSATSSYDYHFLKDPDLIEKSKNSQEDKPKNGTTSREKNENNNMRRTVPKTSGKVNKNTVKIIFSPNTANEYDYFNSNFSTKTSTTGESSEISQKPKKVSKTIFPTATNNETIPESQKTVTKIKTNIKSPTNDSQKIKKPKIKMLSSKNEQKNFIEFHRSFKQSFFSKKMNKEESKQDNLSNVTYYSDKEKEQHETLRKKWDLSSQDLKLNKTAFLKESVLNMMSKNEDKSECSTKISSKISETDSYKLDHYEKSTDRKINNPNAGDSNKDIEMDFDTFLTDQKTFSKTDNIDPKMQETTKKGSILGILKNFSKQLIPRRPKSILKPGLPIPKTMDDATKLSKLNESITKSSSKPTDNIDDQPILRSKTKSIPKQAENISKPSNSKPVAIVLKPVPKTTDDTTKFNKLNDSLTKPNSKPTDNINDQQILVSKKSISKQAENISKPNPTKSDETAFKKLKPSKTHLSIIPKRETKVQKKTKTLKNSKIPRYNPDRLKAGSIYSSKSTSPSGNNSQSTSPERYKKSRSPIRKQSLVKKENEKSFFHPSKEITDPDVLLSMKEIVSSLISNIEEKTQVKGNDKFDKFCMIKPEMVDKSTKLSNEHIPSGNILPYSESSHRPTSLTINTIILNNIESLFSNTNRNMVPNNLIIISPNNLPMINDEVPNIQFSNLSIHTNMIQNLMPSQQQTDNLVNNTQLVLYSAKNKDSLISNSSIDEIKIRELNYTDEPHDTHNSHSLLDPSLFKVNSKCGCIKGIHNICNKSSENINKNHGKRSEMKNLELSPVSKPFFRSSKDSSNSENGSPKNLKKITPRDSIFVHKESYRRKSYKDDEEISVKTSKIQIGKDSKPGKNKKNKLEKPKKTHVVGLHDKLIKKCHCAINKSKKQKCSFCGDKKNKKETKMGIDCDECILASVSSGNIHCTKELCQTKCNKFKKEETPKKEILSSSKLEKCDSKCGKSDEDNCCEHLNISKSDSHDSNESLKKKGSESCCHLKDCPRKLNKTRFKRRVTRLDETSPKSPESNIYVTGSILKAKCEICRQKHANKDQIVTSESYLKKKKKKKKYKKTEYLTSITGVILRKDSLCVDCCTNRTGSAKSKTKVKKDKKKDKVAITKTSNELICEMNCRSYKEDSPVLSKSHSDSKRKKSDEKIESKKNSSDSIKNESEISLKEKSPRSSKEEIEKTKVKSLGKIKNKIKSLKKGKGEECKSAYKVKFPRTSKDEIKKLEEVNSSENESDSVKVKSPRTLKNEIQVFDTSSHGATPKKNCEKCSSKMSKKHSFDLPRKSSKKVRAPSVPKCTCPPEARQLCIAGICGNCRKETCSHNKSKVIPKSSSTSLPEKNSLKMKPAGNSSNSLDTGQRKKNKAPTPSNNDACRSSSLRENITQIKSNVTSKFSCKYFKNLYKYPLKAVASVYRCGKSNHDDVSEQEKKKGNEKARENKSRNKFFCPCLPETTSSVIIYFYMGNSFYDTEDDDSLSWSNTEDDDVILTAEEKRQYLQEKLHLLQDYRSKISNGSTSESNYGAFE